MFFLHGITSSYNECSVYSKGIGLTLILLYFISYSQFGMKQFPVVPGIFLPPNFHIWTLLTSALFNFHLAFLLCDFVTVFLIEKLLMPLWGFKETVKFCVIVQSTTIVSSVLYCYLCYIFTFKLFFLYEVSICGLLPLLGGLSVAGRQMLPDNVIFDLPLGKLRYKHLPFCLFLVFLGFSLFYHVGLHVFLVVFGIYSSWIYLRFFQKHSNGSIGDSGDSFTFAGFFPNHLEPPISILSNSFYSMLVKMKICKVWERKYDLGNPGNISLTINSGDPAEWERRKTIALKALNTRLEKENLTEWPVIDAVEPVAPTAVTVNNPDKSGSPSLLVDGAKSPDDVESAHSSKTTTYPLTNVKIAEAD